MDCKYYNLCNSKNIDYNGNNYNDVFDNIEELLLKIKVKKIWKIEKLEIYKLEKLINSYKEIYKYGAYTFNDENNIIGQKNNNKKFILLLALKNKYISLYTSLDNSLKDYDRVVLTGVLLGYPKCCSEKHYNSIKTLNDAYNSDKKFDKVIFKNGIQCPLINNILKLHVHIPCSNLCIGTIKNSQKVLDYLEEKYGTDIILYFFNKIKGIKK